MSKTDKFSLFSKSIPGALGKIKKSPFKALSVLRSAMSKMAKAPGDIWKKATVLLTSLFTGLDGIGKKKQEVSEKSAKEGQDLTGKFKKISGTIKSLDEFNDGSTKAGFSALAKVAKAVGEEKADADIKLTFDEIANLGAVAFLSLEELKAEAIKKGGDGGGETALAERLKEIEDGSEKTKLPLDKVLSASVFSLMVPNGDPNSKEYKDKLEERGKTLLTRMPGMSLGSAMEAKKLLPQIGTKPMKDRGEVVKFAHKYIFTATSETNVGKILDVIPDLVGNADKATRRKKLAKMVFLMDDDDFGNLVTLLIGERKSKEEV